MKDEIAHFKRSLSDLPYCCRKLIRLQQDLEQAEWEMTGLARHSIPMTKEQENSDLPMPKYHGGGCSIIDRIYEKDKIKAEIRYYRNRILECSSLEWLDHEEQWLLIRLYLLRESQWDVAEEMGLSRSALNRRINAIIRSIL